MARSAQAAPGFKYLGGSSRRYLVLSTGETISREAYDKVHGSLFRRQATSFKRASAAVPEEIRLTRPARGRASKSRRGGSDAFRGLSPLSDRQSRNVTIPFQFYFQSDDETSDDDILDQTDEYMDGYESAVQNILNNSKIGAASIIVTANSPTGGERHITLFPLFDADRPSRISGLAGLGPQSGSNFPTWDEFLEKLLETAYPGTTYGPITIHVRFKVEFLRKSKKAPRKLKTIKRGKKK